MVERSAGRLQTSAEWRNLRDEFLASRDVNTLQAGLAKAVDAIVRGTFESSAAARCPVCVVAVGGYGRGHMYPYSDCDMATVCEAVALSPALKDAVSQFLNLLRQRGVRPNHRLLTMDECLELKEKNPDANISFLERRYLAGDVALQGKVERGLASLFAKNGPKLCQHLCELTRARHSRFGNTPFLLEPDVKEAPGGLRDYRIARALAKLSPGHFPTEEGMEQAGGVIASVRCSLHFRAGDDINLLDREAREDLAAEAGFSLAGYLDAARILFNGVRRAIDSFDKSSSLLDSFRAAQTKLSNEDFTVSRERVFLRKTGELGADPEMAFRLFAFIAQHGLPAAAETERRLEAERASLAAFCAGSRPLWPYFKAALAQPSAASALRLFRDTRALGAMLPEWAAIESSPGDELRVTVDERALVAIETLAAVREPTDGVRQRFGELLSEVDDRPALSFALLLGPCGIEAARAAAQRIQMPGAVRDTVEFLIGHQGDLAEAAESGDTPVVIRRLALGVGTVERLKLLAAFAYARIASEGKEPTEGGRLEQLWRTYSATHHELMQELETDRIGAPPDNMPAYATFLKGFPLRYLRSRSAPEIEADARLYEESRPTGVAAKIEKIEGAYRMVIAARDAPFLFASLAGAIASFGLDIVKAEAFSNSRNTILDTFVFSDPKRTLELNPPEADRLLDLVRRVALGKTEGSRPVPSRSKSDPKRRTIKPEVRFDSEACDNATLVEIVAEDRQGLLYNLATVFSGSGCNIDVVLVDTKGRKAIDVFHVAQEGRKLAPETQEMLRAKILEIC